MLEVVASAPLRFDADGLRELRCISYAGIAESRAHLWFLAGSCLEWGK